MIKNDYGQLNCPFYKQDFDNGVSLIFLPKNSDISSAYIYIAKGGNQLDKDFKPPLGSGYLLNKTILDKDLQGKLKEDKIIAYSDFDYSYSGFHLTYSKDSDIYLPISLILDRITNPFYSEEMIDKVKKEVLPIIDRIENDNIYKSQKLVLKSLYSTAPFKDGFIPTVDQLNLIHASTLKKYQDKYFTSDRIVLFISTSENVDDVVKKIVQFKYPKKKSENISLLQYIEDYSKVVKENANYHIEDSNSYLTFGIKFPTRENIYEAYSDSTFFIYELLSDVLFLKNINFLDSLNKMNSKLVDCKLLQGGEESSLILTIKCIDSNTVASFLVDYLNNIDNNIDSKTFSKVQSSYFNDHVEKLFSPTIATKMFASTYPNHIIETALASSTVNLKFSTFKKFLADLKTFRRSGVFLSRSVK